MWKWSQTESAGNAGVEVELDGICRERGCGSGIRQSPLGV